MDYYCKCDQNGRTTEEIKKHLMKEVPSNTHWNWSETWLKPSRFSLLWRSQIYNISVISSYLDIPRFGTHNSSGVQRSQPWTSHCITCLSALASNALCWKCSFSHVNAAQEKATDKHSKICQFSPPPIISWKCRNFNIRQFLTKI